VCIDSSTMHTVRALLKPDDVDLPESAKPRGGGDVAGVTDVETLTAKDLPGVNAGCFALLP
jgi:hypothetical protein